MKKTFIKYFLAIAVVATSCQKQDTYDIPASETLDPSLVFSDSASMEGTVIAGYNNLQSAEFLSGRALVYVDLLGEDVFDRAGFFGDIPRFNVVASNAIASNVWTAGFTAIGAANRSMTGIAANPTIVSAAKATQLVAENKFIRAISNFYLVNFFAQTYVFTADASHPGIPLIKTSYTSGSGANVARSSVADVYTSIIADLTDALAGLPSSPSAYNASLYSNKVRATKAAAAALLSRVYLYKGDYTNAKALAGNVIAGTYGTYSLNTSVLGAFGPGNYQTAETIFSIPNNATDNPNTNNALPMHYYPTGRADLPLSNAYMSTTTNPYFASDDKRRTQMIIPGVASTSTTAYKFTNKYPDITNRADWAPILRYAEVLLTYAEASARLATGVDADAISKLNIVRDRARVSAAQYTAASFTDKNALINAILGERRIELAFEGHRFWDLMRNKLAVTNKYDSDGSTLLPTQPFGANKNIFPIPQREIDISKGILVQNTGY